MPDYGGRLDLELFKANPSLFLENAMKQYIATSPDNHLSAFGGIPIFDDVLVGFADGDDAIFQDYKRVIGNFHLTPREVLETYLRGKGTDAENHPSRISVISLVLTTPRETRLSMRSETVIASLMGNHAAWEGRDFMRDEVAGFLVSLLRELGYRAVNPETEDFYKIMELPNGPASTWSEKHIAYAAGLGTFGLNSGLITPRGVTIHCISAVTDLALPPSPRIYKNHVANCLFFREGSCGRCVERCPSGALSKQGFDKKRCRTYHLHDQPLILKQLGRQGYIGPNPSCGLCQVKVPCEDRIPPSLLDKNRSH